MDTARNLGEQLLDLIKKIREDVSAHQREKWSNLSAKHARREFRGPDRMVLERARNKRRKTVL